MLSVVKNKSEWLTVVARFPARSVVALRYALTVVDSKQNIDIAEDIKKNLRICEPSQKHLSFTFALISLSAKVAIADGAVSKAEYLAFRDSFPLTGGICSKIRELFVLACNNNTSILSSVSQIKSHFPKQKELFISIIERLFQIAVSDNPLNANEAKLLAKIAQLLDLTPAEYSAIYDKYSRPLPPHIVLGIKKRSPRMVIKKRYHMLMSRYHPDKFSSQKISPEVKMILTLKTTEISQAYKKLSS